MHILIIFCLSFNVAFTKAIAHSIACSTLCGENKKTGDSKGVFAAVLTDLNDHLEFGSYADDTTPFVYGENFDEILGELEKHIAKISEWFLHNYLKVNAKKFHLFLSPFVDKAINIKILP